MFFRSVIFSTRSSRGTPRRKKHFLLDQKEDLRVKEPADGTFHCTFDGVGSPGIRAANFEATDLITVIL
jgi:hypothetical protein